MGKIIVIESDECTGCETCVELCPEVFAFDDVAEVATVIMPDGGDQDCVEEVIVTCPVECISWEED